MGRASVVIANICRTANGNWLLPHLLLLCFLCSLCSLALSASSVVTHLPGFPGPLPFYLETGYVTVDEAKGVELFYYYIKSDRNPEEDPLLLWLTGGPGCSGLCGLVFEIGPLKFAPNKYDRSLPRLVYHPYSWTKYANIIFIDSPVGTGFSFARDLGVAYEVGDMSTSSYIYLFLTKWHIEHPQFLSCPLYIAGDSYAGKIVPLVAGLISQGNDAGKQPPLNLKGYLAGNPFTGEIIDLNSRVPYAHGMGIISDELYKLIQRDCEGEDYSNPTSAKCVTNMGTFQKFLNELDRSHILEPRCPHDSPKPNFMGKNKRSLLVQHMEVLHPPPLPPLKCRSYAYYLSYIWANDNLTRAALHIKKGTVEEWRRCYREIPYINDLASNIKYHLNLARGGFRALVYSGDHDLLVPFVGTHEWIKSLRLPVVDEWRSWHVGGQVAGYTTTYSNLTFATVKGSGHTAPEYTPKECLAMFRRWISNKPL